MVLKSQMSLHEVYVSKKVYIQMHRQNNKKGSSLKQKSVSSLVNAILLFKDLERIDSGFCQIYSLLLDKEREKVERKRS